MSLGHVRNGGNLPWFPWARIGSPLLPIRYRDLGLIFIFLPPLLLSACSIARGQEETSTSQVGRRREPSRESPSASSIIISSLSIDEVRSYCQIQRILTLSCRRTQLDRL